MDMQKTGRLIQGARKRLGLTQNELGERLGVTGKAVSKWENGYSFPDVALLSDISKQTGLSLSALISGDEDKAASEANIGDIALEAGAQIKKKRKLYLLIMLPIVAALILTVVAMSFLLYFSIAPSDAEYQKQFTLTLFGSESTLTLQKKCYVGATEAFGDCGLVLSSKKQRDSYYDFMKQVRGSANEQGYLSADGSLFVKDNADGTADYVYFCVLSHEARLRVLASTLTAHLFTDVEDMDDSHTILVPIQLIGELRKQSASIYIPARAEYTLSATFEEVCDFYERCGYFSMTVSEASAELTSNEKCKTPCAFGFSVTTHSGISYISFYTL